MKPELNIRADGNEHIGLGHLIRCSALGHMMKDDFNITFFSKSIPDSLKQEFEQYNFKVRRITKEKDFLDYISDDKVVVLDGYDFNTEYQKRIKTKGCKLVCIDDLHNQEFVADLIINHTPGITPKDYNAQPYTTFALGLEYVLLRPSFLNHAKEESRIENIETLLISFGGADPQGLTKKTLQVVIQFNIFKKIIVVTGASFIEDPEFLILLNQDNRIEHSQELNEQEMSNAMCEADLAILPASGVLFEALSTGCLVISGQYTINQKLVYENFKKNGLFYDAGNFEESQLKHAIEEAISQPSSVKKMIDGKSQERLEKIIKTIQKEDSIHLRAAQGDDLELTYRWATNPVIRCYSFQQHQITLQEHSSWFLVKVDNPDCIYFIGENSGIPFGSIRFDIVDNEAIISFLVDPEYHGQGLGGVLLKRGLEKLVNEKEYLQQSFNVISGYVLKPNISSIKAFERLGFEKTEYSDKLKFTKHI